MTLGASGKHSMIWDGSWWNRYSSLKVFRLQPMTPWIAGNIMFIHKEFKCHVYSGNKIYFRYTIHHNIGLAFHCIRVFLVVSFSLSDYMLRVIIENVPALLHSRYIWCSSQSSRFIIAMNHINSMQEDIVKLPSAPVFINKPWFKLLPQESVLK